MRWAGHVACMGRKGIPVFGRKREGRSQWEDNIKKIKRRETLISMHLAQDRNQ
jgi:hypothetical protein